MVEEGCRVFRPRPGDRGRPNRGTFYRRRLAAFPFKYARQVIHRRLSVRVFGAKDTAANVEAFPAPFSPLPPMRLLRQGSQPRSLIDCKCPRARPKPALQVERFHSSFSGLGVLGPVGIASNLGRWLSRVSGASGPSTRPLQVRAPRVQFLDRGSGLPFEEPKPGFHRTLTCRGSVP